jgi:uncharacterized low-complexity protein
MSVVTKAAALAGALVMFSASLSGAAADPQTNKHYRRHIASSACPLHRTAEGELVDCRGWRKRSNVGWDNTCFNLDYLPSMFACGGRGRR